MSRGTEDIVLTVVVVIGLVIVIGDVVALGGGATANGSFIRNLVIGGILLIAAASLLVRLRQYRK